MRYSSLQYGLVNQTLQPYIHLLTLIYETKEEQEKRSKQIESETENQRELPPTRIILSVFQSLANTGPVMVRGLFKPFLWTTVFVFRGGVVL